MVNAEDTLETLAEEAGEPVENLLGANCLPLDATILTGDVLYLPRDVEPTPTPDGAETTWAAVGCTAPMTANITSPLPGAMLDGETSILGTAFSPTFTGYRLEIRADRSATYEVLRELEVPALGSVLGTLDLSKRRPDLYWLRLVVETGDDEIAPDAVCVIPIRN